MKDPCRRGVVEGRSGAARHDALGPSELPALLRARVLRQPDERTALAASAQGTLRYRRTRIFAAGSWTLGHSDLIRRAVVCPANHSVTIGRHDGHRNLGPGDIFQPQI